jgi:glycosyltransferase involved in cell wall biosynthesis
LLEPSAPTTDQVVVAHLTAEYLPLVRARHREAFLVGHTVWDTDRIPDHWVPLLGQADLLVVPSRFSAQAIAGSPVRSPVAVVPHVVPPTTEPESDGWGTVPPDAFVFYTIGEWTERKAVFKTIEAYLRAFRRGDNVLLIVKTSQADLRVQPAKDRRRAGEGTSVSAVARLLAKHPDAPPVRLITGALSDRDIADLHRRCDCYVSLCRAEGWGLGAFDAAATANPVVITGFGGQLDFLGESPYLVGFELVPVEDPAGFPSYAPDQHWAEPDVEHGAALLREVFAHSERATALAGSLAADIRERFRPAAVAEAFRSAVEDHCAVVGARGR